MTENESTWRAFDGLFWELVEDEADFALLPPIVEPQAPRSATSGLRQFTALIKLMIPLSAPRYHRFTTGSRAVHIAADWQAGDAGWYACQLVDGAEWRTSLGNDVTGGPVWPDLRFTVARDYPRRAAVESLVADLNAYLADDPGEERVEAWVHLLGERYALDEQTLLFHGWLADDGARITTDRISLRITSAMERYDRVAPRRAFADITREHPAYVSTTDLEAEPLPLLYGDWSDRESWFWLPAAALDTRVALDEGGHQLRWYLSETAGARRLYELPPVALWRSGGDVDRGAPAWRGKFPVVTEADAQGLRGEGTLALSSAQAAEENEFRSSDEIRMAYAQGLADDDGLIDEPVHIARDLLLHVGGVPASRLGESFYEWQTPFRFRRHITKRQALISELVKSLLREAGLVLTVVGDRFEILPNRLLLWDDPTATAQATLRAVDTLDRQEHRLAPRHWHYDGVELRYKRNPATGRTTRRIRLGGTDANDRVLVLESEWIWRDVDAREIAGRYWRAAGHPTRHLTVTVPFAALSWVSNNWFAWTGDGINAQRHLLWEASHDLVSGLSRLTLCRQEIGFPPAQWSSDDAEDYDPQLPEATLRTHGWWTSKIGSDPVDGWSYWRTTP